MPYQIPATDPEPDEPQENRPLPTEPGARRRAMNVWKW